ncbi:armadillo repeat-containing protein 8 isoform X2 [Phalaenopsis equestris]|uniref:armadillo repeat-containing protein 8 isoform X2 n=1 Tax=Phalaenopsis equestris TaxID=78828 RepID=UPI0009E6041E|nr:armadillo repeat-containing protein 8 isoform X2 [Phalaenopsis equestris]
MPTKAASNRPEDLAARLGEVSGVAKGEALLKALREVKNQIIGNKTKKRRFLYLGAVPKIVSVLAAADSDGGDPAIIVQAVAAIGSFACGVEDGVRAVVEAGAVPHLIRILSYPNEKVIDAGARSLRMIFQSKLAPKYDILQNKNMVFLLSLLNSDNENATELAVRIIAHSCDNNDEQNALRDAGVLQRLAQLLEGSLNQRVASLGSIAAIIRNNREVAMTFASIENGKALSALTELIHDRYPRTRYLACMCLIAIGQLSSYACDLQTKTNLLLVLVELLEDSGEVGDDSPFALLDIITDNEELQLQAITINVLEKLCNYLEKSPIPLRRLEGILLALAEFCSKSETCRCQLISPQFLNIIVDALKNESTGVRIAACTCIRNISRSVKNLCAGRLSNERVIVPLVRLLNDTSNSVQEATLGAICNLAVDFTSQKSALVKYGGLPLLVQLSKSIVPMLRLKSLCALRNLMFIANRIGKENIISELTIPELASLICDSEHLVQEQAMALVSNLIHGCVDFIRLVFAEDGLIINAVIRQLKNDSATQVCIQGMLLLCNIAAGDESHKDAVLGYLMPSKTEGSNSLMIRFLQSKDQFLRTAAMWCVLNLTDPDSVNSPLRVRKLQEEGILFQIKTMVNDPWLDCKYRVRKVLEQCMVTQSTRCEAQVGCS